MTSKYFHTGHERFMSMMSLLRIPACFDRTSQNTPPPIFVKNGIIRFVFDNRLKAISASAPCRNFFFSILFRSHFTAFRSIFRRGSSYALQRLGLRRRAYRAALYGSSSYAVGLTAPGPTAQLGHLYGSRSGTLRLGSLRCRAYLAEPYSVARRAVRDSSSSSTAYRLLSYGIARYPLRTEIFGQKQIQFLLT